MTSSLAAPHEQVTDRPRDVVDVATTGDRAYRSLVRLAGLSVLLIMCLVGAFLTYRAVAALQTVGWRFFTTQAWEPDSGRFGIVAVLFGTAVIAIIAIAIAVPLSLGTALYVSEYAPPKLRRGLVSLVDLMAAVPSVVYGLWGAYLLQPVLLVNGPRGDGLPRWLATYFGFFPIFSVANAHPRDPLQTGTVYTSSSFIAGIVVALMVTPVMTSIMREVFSQAPVGEREGAYALGATQWGMVRAVVLPFGVGGIVGGTMLGLGRALGETIAIFMIISPVFVVQPHILQNGAISISALIALRFGEASTIGLSALMAAGLALFCVTLLVNTLASVVIGRSRSGALSDA